LRRNKTVTYKGGRKMEQGKESKKPEAEDKEPYPGVVKGFMVSIPFLSEDGNPGPASEIFQKTEKIGLQARAVALEGVIEILIKQMDDLRCANNTQEFQLSMKQSQINRLSHVVLEQSSDLKICNERRNHLTDDVLKLQEEKKDLKLKVTHLLETILRARAWLEVLSEKDTKKVMTEHINETIQLLKNTI
jgi:hypothetical protein